MLWRDLTPPQQKALAGVGRRERASADDLKCSVSTICALERRRLIVVDMNFDAIAFPRRAKARLTDAGSVLLAGHRKH